MTYDSKITHDIVILNAYIFELKSASGDVFFMNMINSISVVDSVEFS